MEQKNKFDTFDKPDDFDKMLFDYYDNKNEEVPLSTQNTIENAFKDKHKEKSTTIILLKRVAIFILCIGIVTATTVYAKDIINFITNIFINSTPGIDKAVDNGYVQNVDMDFITYNDIGVKVDYVLMDNNNLDISFVYKYYDDNIEIDNISFNTLSIKDENNNMLFWLSENAIPNNDGIVLLDTNAKFNNIEKNIENKTIRSSLLLTSENFPNSQILTISISSIAIKINNQSTYVDGNWNFSINLDNKFVTRNSSEYHSNSTSPYVDSVKTSLSNTSLIIELNFNVLLDEMNFIRPTNITLYDNNNVNYNYTNLNIKNISTVEPYSSVMTITYPITSYDNIDSLCLHINLSSENSIDVKLLK